MLRISLTDEVSNNKVLRRALIDENLICKIRHRSLGNVLRNDILENVALENLKGKGAEEGNGCC